MKWFETFILAQTALFLLHSVCRDPRFDAPICSMSAPEGHSLPLATESETMKHTFRRCKTRWESRKKIKQSFHWGSKTLAADFQGFILFNTEEMIEGVLPEFIKPDESEEWSNIFHIELPLLMKTPAYRKKIGTIFARLSGDTDHRMGDKKRGQCKLSQMLKIATRRFKSAKTDRLKDVASKEIELIERARNLAARLYKGLVQVRAAID